MSAEDWKKRIVQACEEAGTYRTFFDSVIDTLANLMETRDNAQAQFEKLKKQTVIKHTNKGGATNVVKNPALVVLMDCNTQALNYWTALGLTPKGYKALGAEVAKDESVGAFERLLEKIM